jgi:PAS domain S-box-containing protein
MKEPCKKKSGLLHRDWGPFRRFFEQNEEAIAVFHPDACCIVDVNMAACRLFGYNHDELIDGGLALFCNPDEFDKIEALICNAGPVQRPYVTTYFKRDGTKSVLKFRSNSINLKSGRLVYCSFRDIGEEIRIKEEMRFHHAQLIHANKMGALGMLVSSVAHEINNPNNFIMHNIQILSEALKDALPILREHYKEHGDYYLGGIPLSEFEEVVPRLVFGIQDGSDRIRKIVENLRNFVRSDRARLDCRIEIAAVVANAVSLMRSEIDKHTGNFSFTCDPNLPQVRGSSQKLEQVVINLIMNALQSLTDRQQRVVVTASTEPDTGLVVVAIKDEGCGMSESVRSRIMEPFFSTKQDNGGTGLGLYISNSIIREHKGSISFISLPDQGTTVTVKLPAAEEKSKNDQNREPSATGFAG